MKRSLIIALCCITALFAACNKENPNEKFIGYYEGNGTVNGTFSVTLPTGQSFDQELNNISIPMSIQLTAGETKNEVILTYTNEDVAETYTATGVVTDNTVDFNPVSINQVIEGTTVAATLDMDGTLLEAEGILQLNGTVEGSGSMTESGMTLPFTMSGTVSADLNKVDSPTPSEPDVEPSLSLKTGTGYLAEGDEVEMGSTINVGFIGAGKNLTTLNVVFTADGEVFSSSDLDCDGNNSFEEDEEFLMSQRGNITMTATLIDSKSRTATVTCNFTVTGDDEVELDDTYDGTVTLDGTLATTIGFSYPISGVEFGMTIDFNEPTTGNLEATVTFQDNTYVTTGTRTDLSFVLEPIDINLDVQGSNLTSTLTLGGSIGDDTILIEGAIEGSGEASIPEMPMPIPVTLTGTVTGTLTETSR